MIIDYTRIKILLFAFKVEMEVRDSLSQYGFDGENTPIVIGSALCALEVNCCSKLQA